MARFGALLMAFLLLPSSLCFAERVSVPLILDSDFVELLLNEQVFSGVGHSLRLFDDGSGCQSLTLREPQTSAQGNQVVVRARAEARAGRAVGTRCLLILNWSGQLELVQQPVIGDDRESLVLKTTLWRVLDREGNTAPAPNMVAQWLEAYLPVRLGEIPINFSEPIHQLRTVLSSMVDPSSVADTLAIDHVGAAEDQVIVTLGMEAPPARVRAPRVEPALSEAELAGLEQSLDAVDAFFTHTVRSVGDTAGGEDPETLFEVLIELRRKLIRILSEPPSGGDDPARSLFVEAWESLTPAVRAVAADQRDTTSALRYLTFLGAGDALRALDRLGPTTGIDVSGNGLRRLARILSPEDAADPLARDDAVDPALRRSLGFGDPLPPPEADASSTSVDVLSWLVPSAWAASTLDPAMVKRLNNWVPKTGDMTTYLPMVRDVLWHAVTEQVRRSELDAGFHQLFRWLVFATAWQESCWRQFVAENNMRVPMRSGSGDLGMMQINPRVWRGLYDLQGLRWDIVYNARAGADILDHYLIKYAIRNREQRASGGVDNLARSTYAAYNGGPRQYDRYRRADASAQGKKVDRLFYEKYREIQRGKDLAVAACYGG